MLSHLHFTGILAITYIISFRVVNNHLRSVECQDFLNVLACLGVIAARDATLTFMVGGQEDNFAIAEEILQHIGKNVVHCGAVGTGQVTIFIRL